MSESWGINREHKNIFVHSVTRPNRGPASNYLFVPDSYQSLLLLLDQNADIYRPLAT